MGTPLAWWETFFSGMILDSWRFLQNDDLKSAEQEFTAALKVVPDFVPARTGEGYVALARQDYMRALDQFELALRGAPAYAPALVGKGQALLSMNRDSDARAAFEAALKADPSLANLGARIDVLKFREIQNLIAAARQAMNAGRLDEARAAYQRALAATPDSAVLYRELGMVERRQGDTAAATPMRLNTDRSSLGNVSLRSLRHSAYCGLSGWPGWSVMYPPSCRRTTDQPSRCSIG